MFSTLRSHSRLRSHSNSCVLSHTKRFGRSSRRSRRSGRGISTRSTCPRRRTASRCAASRAPTAQHSVFCTTFLQMHAVITQMLICAQTAAAAVLHRWPSLSSRHRRASLAFCLNLCPLQGRSSIGPSRQKRRRRQPLQRRVGWPAIAGRLAAGSLVSLQCSKTVQAFTTVCTVFYLPSGDVCGCFCCCCGGCVWGEWAGTSVSPRISRCLLWLGGGEAQPAGGSLAQLESAMAAITGMYS